MNNDQQKKRIEEYYKIASNLAHIDKNKLDVLLNGKNKSEGWGKNHIIKLDKSKVFVKRIPLTELEYKNMFSTKNLYNLPVYYNYGVGSAGFGAFRELIIHIKTTNWVLAGEIENFPLMYHYRIIEAFDKKIEIDPEKHKKYLKRWNNNENISKYIIERKNAKYEIVIFLEYIPYKLLDWLPKNTNKLKQVLNEMTETIAFLRKKKIIHMDMHFANILSDGEKSYLADFGLALDRNFNLSKKEKAFFESHINYDYGEFISCLGLNIFNSYEKDIGEKLKEYQSTNKSENQELFITFLENIEKINAGNLIKLDKNHINFLVKYHDIIVFFFEFYKEINQNNRKNTIFNSEKLNTFLNQTELPFLTHPN